MEPTHNVTISLESLGKSTMEENERLLSMQKVKQGESVAKMGE